MRTDRNPSTRRPQLRRAAGGSVRRFPFWSVMAMITARVLRPRLLLRSVLPTSSEAPCYGDLFDLHIDAILPKNHV